MGKIWVRLSTEKVIHLPIVENDVNTAVNPIDIPPAVSVNRCFSEQRIIVHPTLGTITFDFRPPGIIGSCNQCGHCCTHLVGDCLNPSDCAWSYNSDIDAHACPYLVIDKWRKFPEPNNTECSLYADILNQYKGCAYVPDAINPLWINCGYSF